MNKDAFIKMIQSKNSAPFLFLGSGFTKHYLDTPNWEELLSKFADKHLNAYYTSLGTEDLSVIATEIAKEENDKFWKLPEDDSFKKAFQEEAKTPSSVLKAKIAAYFKKFALGDIPEKYNEELELLQNIHIDGIITTNYDDLVERLFPKFTKYVGQNEL